MKTRVFLLAAVAPLWMLCVASFGADTHPSDSAAATLHLANGDFVTGELSDCAESGILRWQGASFAGPSGLAMLTPGSTWSAAQSSALIPTLTL